MDLFATPSLGETEFQQNVKYRIAQEGELARLISTLDAVRSAKVSLALPEKSLFAENQEETTASVSLNLANKNISRDQVETVLHLVAGAVEGLSPRSVRITDQSGKLLSAGMSDESASGNMDDNYAYKRRYEKELAAGIIGQLEEVVGQNRVKVNVSAHMRFDRNACERRR